MCAERSSLPAQADLYSYLQRLPADVIVNLDKQAGNIVPARTLEASVPDMRERGRLKPGMIADRKVVRPFRQP